jgi:hypothetical protein
MSIKGWTKMKNYQWRHDNFGINNKLNVFLSTEDGDWSEKHASNHQGPTKHGYVVLYTDNDRLVNDDVAKSYILSHHNTLKDASAFATNWMRNNETSVDINE